MEIATYRIKKMVTTGQENQADFASRQQYIT